MKQMSKSYRILLNDELLPVQAFFNAISEHSFIKTLEAFSNGIGASFDDCHCEFPGEMDSDDEIFSGIQFALYEKEVVISYSEFLEYLAIVCDSFTSERPDLKEEVARKFKAVESSILNG